MQVINRTNTSGPFFDMLEEIFSDYANDLAGGTVSDITFDLTSHGTVEFWKSTSDRDHLMMIMVFGTLAEATDHFRVMKRMTEADFLTMVNNTLAEAAKK